MQSYIVNQHKNHINIGNVMIVVYDSKQDISLSKKKNKHLNA